MYEIRCAEEDMWWFKYAMSRFSFKIFVATSMVMVCCFDIALYPKQVDQFLLNLICVHILVTTDGVFLITINLGEGVAKFIDRTENSRKNSGINYLYFCDYHMWRNIETSLEIWRPTVLLIFLFCLSVWKFVQCCCFVLFPPPFF